MFNTPGYKAPPGPGTREDQLVFNPLLNVSDTVRYPGGITIHEDSEDFGHTSKETILRAGLALVRIETGDDKGKFVPAKHTDAPAPEDVVLAVILLETIKMDDTGAVQDKVGVEAMIAGTVDEAKIFFDDATYTDAIKAALPRVSFLSAPA